MKIIRQRLQHTFCKRFDNLPYFCRSFDLSPIKHVLYFMARQLSNLRHPPKILNGLRLWLQEVWDEETTNYLIESLRPRVI
jgi:hypothetical protein